MLLPTTTSVGSSPTYSPSPTEGFGQNTETVANVLESMGQYTTFLSPLLSGEIIGKTIGQALTDGFDCWGSSWTPSRAEDELPTWMSKIGMAFQTALDVPANQLESSINKFFVDVYDLYIDSNRPLGYWMHWRYTSAKDCTLRGLKELEKGVNAYLKDEILKALKAVCQELGYSITTYKDNKVMLHRPDRGADYAYYTHRVKITIPVKQNTSDSSDLSSTSPKLMGGGIGLLLLAGLAWYNRKKLF